jgi:hypothetical protein
MSEPANVRWYHTDCPYSGLVVWDLAGGYCMDCGEENLTEADCWQGYRGKRITDLPDL